MIIHKLNPVLLQIGALEIHYYGLFYILGAIITFFILNYLIKKKQIALSKEDIFDFTIYELIGIFLGARILYFIFYNFTLLTKNFLELFMVWHGGMSFHGGLIGAIIVGYIFSKKKNINFWQLADLTVIPLALALALGRIGNFINGEIYGKIWNGFACINYEQNPYLNNSPEFCRYPVQFIESIKNFFIFLVLWYFKDKKLPRGTLFWIFITLYGFLRFLVEFLRHQNEAYILDYFSRAQIFSLIMLIIGIIMLYKKLRKII